MTNPFSWINSESLRAAADFTTNGGILSQEDANTVLDELRRESVEHIRRLVGERFYAQNFPTARTGGQWRDGRPVGIVDHYTAGISARGTLRWFSNQPRGPEVGNSSAHVVVPRNGAILVLIDPRERVAWHATWANKSHIGIEHVNAGLLRKTNRGGMYYREELPFPKDRLNQIQHVDGRFWESYTCAQVCNNIIFKRWLVAAIPSLDREEFVDHEAIDPERKEDCGPLWPLNDINDLAFSGVPIRDFTALQAETLSQVGVFEFHREVQEALLASTIPGDDPRPDFIE